MAGVNPMTLWMMTISFLLLIFSVDVLGNEVALFSHVKSMLRRGESLTNNGSSLTLQTDCDLVLRDANNMIVWNSGSVDKGVNCIFWIGKYGVVIISDTEGIPLWTAGNPGPRGNYAVLLRPDGKLRTYGPSIWTFLGPSSNNNTDGDSTSDSNDTISNEVKNSNSSSDGSTSYIAGVVGRRADRHNQVIRTTTSSPPSPSPSPIDSSGYILYSSEDFIYRPSIGVLLTRGNFTLVLETTCTIHIRRKNDVDSKSYKAAERQRGVVGSTPVPCKTQLTTAGELAAYKQIFSDEGGLDDVWLRTWGSDFTIVTKDSIAALVDRGVRAELVVYPVKQTLA